MNGILSGGWNFVIAAFAVSGIVLGGYCIHAVRQFFATRGSAQ
jgi:hypothetical protein